MMRVGLWYANPERKRIVFDMRCGKMVRCGTVSSASWGPDLSSCMSQTTDMERQFVVPADTVVKVENDHLYIGANAVRPGYWAIQA